MNWSRLIPISSHAGPVHCSTSSCGNDVVPGGHRRVRREDGRRPHLTHRVLERHAIRRAFPQPLDEHERRVALVGVPHARIDADRAQHPDARDAERPFLLEPLLGPAGVEPAGQAPVGGIVLLEIRVEQEHRDAPHPHPPRADVDRPAEGAHHREPRLALGPDERLERPHARVEPLVGVLLPAVEPDPLVEIALRVEQTDRHQRHAQVGRRLAVIARENAQAAGVDRDGVVEPELGAEVRRGASPGGPGTPGRTRCRSWTPPSGDRSSRGRTAGGTWCRGRRRPAAWGPRGAAARADCGASGARADGRGPGTGPGRPGSSSRRR